MEPFIIKNKSNGSILKLFYSVKDPEKRRFRYHRHAEFEISLFKQGAGQYKILNTSYDISSGDVFLFGTNEVHCITEINAPMRLMNIQFEPRFVWGLENSLLKTSCLKIFFGRPHGKRNRLDRKNPATAEIRRLLLEIEDEFIRKDKEYELMINIKLLNIFALLLRSFSYSDEEVSGVNPQGFELIDKSVTYINEHLCEDLTLEDIASVANMSRTYFSSLFKKLNGISPWDYITIKRVEKSIDMIKNTNKTVLEIATECGFNSTANFNRSFKKVTNKVPSDYRGQKNN